AVSYIANNRNLKPFKTTFMILNREGIQKCLCRVLMHPVTCIDNGAVSTMLSQQLGCTGGMVPHYDNVRIHRLQVLSGINQRFTLDDTAAGDIEIDCVGTQSLRRNLE